MNVPFRRRHVSKGFAHAGVSKVRPLQRVKHVWIQKRMHRPKKVVSSSTEPTLTPSICTDYRACARAHIRTHAHARTHASHT